MGDTAYRCRFVCPGESDWHEVSESSPERAANEFHSWYVPHGHGGYLSLHYTPDADRAGALIHYANIEVEGHGVVTSRVYHSGLARRGGTKPWPDCGPAALRAIAAKLGWSDPAALLAEGWNGEDRP